MFKNKSQKAFTLIELLVVMAIIAILSAIMFGPIQTARRRSKDTQAVADMKLLQNYLTLWGQDHHDVYPLSLSALSVYGALPKRANLVGPEGSSNNTLGSYNYFLLGPIDCFLTGGDTNNTCTGFHLWTHLNDMNEAFNTDSDCNSIDSGTADFLKCWNLGDEPSNSNLEAWGKSGNDSTGDGDTNNHTPSASVCKDTSKCILDYANNK